MRMMEQLVPLIAFGLACAAKDADCIDTACYCILDMQKSSFAWFVCPVSDKDLRHNPLAPMMLRGIPPYTATFSAVDFPAFWHHKLLVLHQLLSMILNSDELYTGCAGMNYYAALEKGSIGHRVHNLVVLCFRMLCSLLSKSFKHCLNDLNCNSYVAFQCFSMQFSSATAI